MEKKKISARRHIYDKVMKFLMIFSIAVISLLVLFFVVYILEKGLPNITWQLLTTK